MMTEPLLLHRIDPTRNMARFYRLSIEPNLFGGVSLVRTWGRIGAKGRTMIELQETLREGECRRDALARMKRRRGYEETKPPAEHCR